MQNILKNLYHGKITPDTKQFVSGSDYERWLTILTDCDEKLRIELTNEQAALLTSLQNAQAELNGIANCEDFAEGFRLGAQMMLAVLEKNDGDLTEINR